MFDRTGTWALAIAMCAAGCGTSLQYAETNHPPRPMRPRPAADVEVFTSKPPEQPYVEVGIIEAQQQSGWSLDDMPAIVTKLREFAAQHGCDGVVMAGNNDRVVGDNKTTTTLKGYRATCIVFTPPSAPAPAGADPADVPVAPAASGVSGVPATPAAAPSPSTPPPRTNP
jgi:hypothetical protein